MAKFVENVLFGLAIGIGLLMAYGVLRLIVGVMSGAGPHF